MECCFLNKKLHGSIYRLFLSFLLTVFLTVPVHSAQEPSQTAEEKQKDTQQPENEAINWLEQISDPIQWETWHDQMSTNVLDAGEQADLFFGDERLDEENQRTRLRLGTGLGWKQDDGASLLTEVKLRLSLPHLKNRYQIIVDDSFESEEPGSSTAYSDAVKDSEPDTAIRYIIKQDERRRLSADAGVRLSSPSQLFGRMRGRVIVPFPVWELRLTQTVAWFTDDGFIETSEMRFSRLLGYDWLFRSSSRVTWEENKNGITPAQQFSFFREISKRRAYRVSLGGYWPETPHAHEAVYSAEFSYRQLIHSRWLFLEITPGIEFPQKKAYELTPYINVQFEMIFGDES